MNPPSASAETARHDLYRDLHKGLRVALFDTVRRLGRLEPDDAEPLQRTLDQAQRLLALLASHVKHENDFLHTAIEARQPGTVQRACDEHRAQVDGIHALNAELAALRRAEPAERDALVQRLYRHFAALAAEHLQHMQHEEIDNNPVLWALYSDAELIALQGRLLASVEPHILLDALTWMAQALRPREVAQLLRALPSKVSPEAVDALLAPLRDRGAAPEANSGVRSTEDFQ